ncbi:MAG: hypothetical protein ACREOU_08490 [Candidatus Eiseniibacteriota bacterium]
MSRNLARIAGRALLLGAAAPVSAMLMTLASIPEPAWAAGTVDLSWNACAPLTVNRNSNGGESISLFASVVGHSEAHQGYQVWLVLGSASGTTPDAWQFEAEGCHGFAPVTIDHASPAGRTCPSFQGSNPSLQVKTFDDRAPEIGPEYGAGLRRIVLANAYPAGVSAVSSAQRYFLMRVLFDHSLSTTGPGSPGSTCGGLETPVCVLLVERKLTWLDPNGVELPFSSGQSYVTFNDLQNEARCSGNRVIDRTWGAIKGEYHR